MRSRFKPTKKQSRQDMILRIIKERNVSTQKALEKALTKFGFKTTQSSLSRDSSELGLVKHHGCYVPAPQSVSHGSTPLITSVESAGSNLIVIKTFAGMASPVGITIDSKKIFGIIGTVAGDDTVFVATALATSHEPIKKTIRNLFKGE